MTTESLNSIGFVCQTLQRAPGHIRKAADKLGIKPAVLLNGIPHYADEAVEQLRRHFADTSEARTND